MTCWSRQFLQGVEVIRRSNSSPVAQNFRHVTASLGHFRNQKTRRASHGCRTELNGITYNQVACRKTKIEEQFRN